MSKGMRLLLIAVIVVFAFAAAKAVDRVANGTPVRVGKVRWKADDYSCTVAFHLRNQTLISRKVGVLITLYHSGDPAGSPDEASKTICGYSAVRADLDPLQLRAMSIAVPTTKRATECEVELEPVQ